MSSNLTSGFIDIATYGEMESKLYGGQTAMTYFVRNTQKSTWFTQVPCSLSKQGTSGFGSTSTFQISRAGDYLLGTYLDVTLTGPNFDAWTSSTETNPAYNKIAGAFWAKDIGNTMIEEVSLTFNDLVAVKMSGEHLNFWSKFTVPAGKRDVYRKMIGGGLYETADDGSTVFTAGLPAAFNGTTLSNGVPTKIASLDTTAATTTPATTGVVTVSSMASANPNAAIASRAPATFMTFEAGHAPGSEFLTGNSINTSKSTLQHADFDKKAWTGTVHKLSVPIPFFFGRDSGLALPTAALPYNDMKINVKLRPSSDLITYTNLNGQVMSPPNSLTVQPAIQLECHANYAIVTNDERTLMGAAPRDIVIEQSVKCTSAEIGGTHKKANLDLRLSHSVKALFFGVRQNDPLVTLATTKVNDADSNVGATTMVPVDTDLLNDTTVNGKVVNTGVYAGDSSLAKNVIPTCSSASRRPGSRFAAYDEFTADAAEEWLRRHTNVSVSDDVFFNSLSDFLSPDSIGAFSAESGATGNALTNIYTNYGNTTVTTGTDALVGIGYTTRIADGTPTFTVTQFGSGTPTAVPKSYVSAIVSRLRGANGLDLLRQLVQDVNKLKGNVFDASKGRMVSYNPIKDVVVKYENAIRLSESGSYFTQMQPYMHADVIPDEKGYHCYSYALNLASVEPQGSTNYGKLTNVSLDATLWRQTSGDVTTPLSNVAGDALASAASKFGDFPSYDHANAQAQQRVLDVTAVNWNMCRISGGALGFPIL